MKVSPHALTRWMGRGPVIPDRVTAEGSLRARVAAAKPITGRQVVQIIGRGRYRDRQFRADREFVYVLSGDQRSVITVLDRRR